MTVRFGSFEVDLDSGDVRRAGALRTRLQDQPLQVLAMLVERPGELVAREAIRQKLWPENVHTDHDQGIAKAVLKLRAALGDSAESPRFIETLPRRGYRFVADVRYDGPADVQGRLDAGRRAGRLADVEEKADREGGTARKRVSILLLALGVLALVGLATWPRLRDAGQPSRSVTRFTIRLKNEFSGFGNLAIAPDGSRIAYVALEGDGERRLYLRELDAFESMRVDGTEGAHRPFFSPDGRWVGFVGRHDVLQKVSVAGGPPLELGHTPWVGAATWVSHDRILVGAGLPGRTWLVPASGGAVRPLEIPGDDEGRPFVPLQVLPGGELLAATWESEEDSASVELVSAETGERRRLLRASGDVSSFRYLASGHLLWAEGGALLVVRVDLERGVAVGEPVPVLEGLSTYLDKGHNVAVSESGTLVYAASTGPRESRLTWVDRAGKATPVPGGRDTSFFVPDPRRLSPDGREAAVTLMESQDRDIWIFDLERGTRRRLTTEGVNRSPVWSPDGDWIAYQSNRGRLEGVFRTRSDGSGADELLFERPARPFPVAWSPDGRTLAFVAPEPTMDVFVHSLGGESSAVVTGAAEEDYPAFSPDWHWLAFESDESGQREIYLRPCPGPGASTVVSTSGGGRPAWAPGGDELYYSTEGGSRVMAVRVELTPRVRIGTPRVLFEGPFWEGVEVSPEGERFLMLRKEDPSPITELRVVVNWAEELAGRVP